MRRGRSATGTFALSRTEIAGASRLFATVGASARLVPFLRERRELREVASSAPATRRARRSPRGPPKSEPKCPKVRLQPSAEKFRSAAPAPIAEPYITDLPRRARVAVVCCRSRQASAPRARQHHLRRSVRIVDACSLRSRSTSSRRRPIAARECASVVRCSQHCVQDVGCVSGQVSSRVAVRIARSSVATAVRFAPPVAGHHA